VTLDDTWTLQSDEKGHVAFQNVPPGSHEVRIRRAGARFTQSVITSATQPTATISFDAAR